MITPPLAPESPVVCFRVSPKCRAYQYVRLMWQGVPSARAAADLNIKPGTARKMRERLRKEAALVVGAPVTDVLVFRLLFDAAGVRRGDLADNNIHREYS